MPYTCGTSQIAPRLTYKLEIFGHFGCFLCAAVITCTDPGAPSNGRRQGTDFSIGGEVFYQCDFGYILEGDVRRQCEQDGEWSGDLPACESKLRNNDL